jgi:hypothetical protein
MEIATIRANVVEDREAIIAKVFTRLNRYIANIIKLQ